MNATCTIVKIEQHLFEENDEVPNSRYPVLIYRYLFNDEGEKRALWLESRFNQNRWTNSWKWGIYDYHHFHSNTHEVLGVYQGEAELQLGGVTGKILRIQTGDVIIIPAGVAHKSISSSETFAVVGAYPNGIMPDLQKINSGKLPLISQKLKSLKKPDTDPIFGKKEGLLKFWK